MEDFEERKYGGILRPSAAAMIEALRDIGYSMEAAVADIIDNSITAQAKHVHIRYGWTSEEPWIAVLDDGTGMTPDTLLEAMRLGSVNPRDRRAPDDLGRFGLGLKTASFSQSRCLTVVTVKGRTTSAWRWDLDEVSRRDEWTLLKLDGAELTRLPALDELGRQGTYVLWQKLDRLDLGNNSERAHTLLNERLDTVRKHLALVFHRYLTGEPSLPRLEILINQNAVAPFDPFNVRNPSTQHLLEERVKFDAAEVVIQPFILPHHSKVSPSEYDRYAGEEGYLRSQGFYVYRNRRLIRHGTWFRLGRQEELTKLARVRIDIPNSLDYLWTIDVRKSRANPPEIVRERMRRVVERIRGSAKRPYTHRGTVIEQRRADAVWRRRVFNDRIQYEIDPDHPVLEDLRGDLDQNLRKRFDLALRMIAGALPIPLLFSDMASQPTKTDISHPDRDLLVNLATLIRDGNPGISQVDLRQLLLGIEPFATWPDCIENVLSQL